MARVFQQACAGVLAVTVAAGGQSQRPDEPVDQAIADLTALSASLRSLPPGLQQSGDFSQVYRTQQGLTRTQGALSLVFPQSAYGVDKDGRILALVPPGTVYYVGPATTPAARPSPAARPGRLEARIDDRIAALPLAGPAGPDPASQADGTPSPGMTWEPPVAAPRADRMVVDPAYRRQRLRDLLHDAAQTATRREAGRRHRRRNGPGSRGPAPGPPSAG